MATHQLAQGLASLGRHGDSMLMHVTPREVTGLKNLAKSMGGEVTTNPHTGLPEASFFDFIGNMLPTIAAIALAAPTGGTSLAAVPETMAANVAATTAASAPGFLASMQAAPIIGGMATGAAVAGAKGEDPLMGGIMGGVSGIGAPGMADAFNKMASGAAPVLQGTMPNIGGVPSEAIGANTLQTQAPGFGGLGFGTNTAAEVQAMNAANPALTSNILDRAGSNLANVGSGISDFAMHPLDTYDKFTKAGGSGSQLALGVGLPAIRAMQPKPIDTAAALKEEEEKRKAQENKYRDSRTGLLNLTQASPDLRLAASGGLMSAYATGGTVNTNSSTISSGGIQDLYGTNDQTTGTQNLSKEGYGIGRLNSLAAEGSRAKAADTFYAMGGPIAFAKGGHQGYLDGAGDGMSDSIPATIEGKQPARLADGEFVIPADVVSHIGNGSSKAGSKQLYAMLDRIRKARTGHTKQGKEIKPHKYMPA
jgi:hypothetical protein